MNETKTGASPSISSLDPSNVDQGWEGTVRIHGSGFDNSSFSLFDGVVLRTTYVSDILLEAEVKSDITGGAGTKNVKVHTGGGGVSNEVDLMVSPGGEMAARPQYVDGDVDAAEIDGQLVILDTTSLSADNTDGKYGKNNLMAKLYFTSGSPRTYRLADYLPRGDRVGIDISGLGRKVVKVEWRFNYSTADQYVITYKAPAGLYFKVALASWGYFTDPGDNDEFRFFGGEEPI